MCMSTAQHIKPLNKTKKSVVNAMKVKKKKKD